MSYKIVERGKGKECFRYFFLKWSTLREVSKNLYPQSSSKTIPLVSRHFNQFLTLGYLEERIMKEPVRRGNQEYTRAARKFRGNLKPFLEYAKEKKVVFESLEEKMLTELLDNPWSLEGFPSINFREYIVEQGTDVIKGLKTLFRDSIIYSFFIDHIWSAGKLSVKDLEVTYPKNDFYRLGKTLVFDEVLYTKVALLVFDPPLDNMIKIYPKHFVIPPMKKGLLKIQKVYEAVDEMHKEIKEKRREELPEVYKRFKENVQRHAQEKVKRFSATLPGEE